MDAAIELSSGSKVKADLLYLLLEHGARIMCCNIPKKKKTTFLCIVTHLAIDTGKHFVWFQFYKDKKS